MQKSLILLEEIPNSIYINDSLGPFYSSIGVHIRHILDFYTSIFNGIDSNLIDLSNRERNSVIESDIIYAKAKIKTVLAQLDTFSTYELEGSYNLTDDLGMGKVTIPTNLYAILVQANSHTIHHYAIISQLLYTYDIVIADKTFGYNPTSPIKEIINR
ncbi:MAG: hypothetical protein ACPG45_04055 [Flavobacteriaceae bacterium]